MPTKKNRDKKKPSDIVPVSDKDNVRELEASIEEDYLKKVKAKNSKGLIKLDMFEKERIARHIKDLYNSVKEHHNELCDKIDDYDKTFRMERRNIIGDDGDLPNYTTPLSTVTLEVIHANIMNVFFTPKDTMRVIPTEQNDIPKIKKLDIFGNWSMKNELELFERCDRLFHSSGKNGECPYMVHWVKEYGTEIKVEPIPDPANPGQFLLDPDTKEPLLQEKEESKLLYNAPKLEIFSRKDYILPKNASNDKKPDWEMRIIRLNADKTRRYCLEGKFYDNTFDEIEGWLTKETTDTENRKIDKQGEDIPLGRTEKLFVEFYGTLRLNQIKNDKNGDESYEELEDEFIAIVELKSETLCSLKKNKFPLKMRPIGLDECIPDDEGRIGAMGIMEFMDSIQKSYDSLHNQYLFGVIQANNPFGFFTPLGNNKDEPIKVKSGNIYPTSDPGSINIVKIPPPDNTIKEMLELVRYWGQLLFGIGDYQAGIESTIDPSAPAKKAEIVVAQGNVRLNLIIKRKNKTLKDIFKRWFLLYQANMPANKFMRIAGDEKDNPWKFDAINLSDFALNSIPDFELTGNILNANKALEVNKSLATYQLLLANPFFSPQTAQGLQSLHALTKWFLDKLDETGVSGFLPSMDRKNILTPEEENARFLQGDVVDPQEGEDYIYHIRIHGTFLMNPSIPDDIKQKVAKHIQDTVQMMRQQMTQQMALQQANAVQPQKEVVGVGQGQERTGAPAKPANTIPEQGMGGFETGDNAGV